MISIISVNYKQLNLTVEFLKSVFQISYPKFEVIVVDNNSGEHLDPIKKYFPQVKLIESEKNLGYAGGINLGIRNAEGDYFMILNNDTIVEKSFLEPLVQCFIDDPEAGLASPKIKYYDEKNRIQYAGYNDLSPITLRNSIIGYGEIDVGKYNQRTYTAFAHGAAMMTSRKILKKCGMMSELFFLYYEEIDFALRIRNAGYKVIYEPKSLVYHKESVATGKNSPLKTYFLARNRLLLLRRNFSGLIFLSGYLYILLIATFKHVFLHILKGEFVYISSYITGIAWNFTNPGKDKLLGNSELIDEKINS